MLSRSIPRPVFFLLFFVIKSMNGFLEYCMFLFSVKHGKQPEAGNFPLVLFPWSYKGAGMESSGGRKQLI